jgi:SAM-dependent methyltransferase
MDTLSSYLYNSSRREWYFAFLAATDQKRNTVDVMVRGIKEKAPHLFHEPPSPYPNLPVRILDIGTGTGQTLIDFADRAFPGARNFTIHEPNLGSYIFFLSQYRRRGHSFNSLRPYDNDGKERFVCTRPEEFEVITASHAFYYIPDWESSLKEFYRALTRGGVGIIALTSESGALHRLRKKFFPAVETMELGEPNPHSAEDLCSVLDSLSIPYEAETLESRVDVTDLLNRKGGENLASFFIRYDWNSTDTTVIEEVLTDIEKMSITAADRKYLPLTDQLVWIKKPGEFVPRDIYVDYPQGWEEEYDETYLSDLMRFLSDPLKRALGKEFEEMHPDLRQALAGLMVMDGMLSDPILRGNVENFPQNLLLGMTFEYKDGKPVLAVEDPEEMLVFPADYIDPEEPWPQKSEKFGLQTLDDLVWMHGQRLTQEGHFKSAEKFERWLWYAYRGNARFLSPNGRSLLVRLLEMEKPERAELGKRREVHLANLKRHYEWAVESDSVRVARHVIPTLFR